MYTDAATMPVNMNTRDHLQVISLECLQSAAVKVCSLYPMEMQRRVSPIHLAIHSIQSNASQLAIFSQVHQVLLVCPVEVGSLYLP